MATNIRQGELGYPVHRLGVICTAPASPVANDPVLWGTVPGVADTTKDTVTGLTTVVMDCMADIPVKGINAGGNVAVNASDELFYTAGDTPPVSKKATGVHFGWAKSDAPANGVPSIHTGQVVASGATATIRVFVSR